MIWSENSIAAALARQTFQRKAIVLVPNCTWTGYECDLLVVTNSLRIIDVEVKISRADLKKDAGKGKWWEHYINPADAVQRGLVEQEALWDKWKDKAQRSWPYKVWKHYYAMPAEIWNDSLLDSLPSPNSGVIALSVTRHGAISADVVRRAKPDRDAHVLTPDAAIDIARLANLRYWDVVTNLERTRKLLDEARAAKQEAA